MPVAESSVLRPRSADLKNSDDWPIFTLTNANVVSQDSAQPCSLLDAHKDHEVRVTGRLGEIPDELAHIILDANYGNRTIQLDDVAIYSYAEYEDGTYGYWAGGQAGWFELEETVPKYRPILAEMNVATSMLYFIADKIRRSRKTGFTDAEFNKHIRRLFHDYCAQERFPHLFSDPADVREGFERHRHFLISAILEGQEGITWTEAPLLQYFANKFPDDVRNIKARVFGLPSVSQSKDPRKQTASTSQAEQAPAKKRRGRPPKSSQDSQPRTPGSDRQSYPNNVTGDSDDDMDLALIDDDEGRPVNPRKRKSILQPSGSKYSKKAKKGAGRRRSRLIPENPYLSDVADSDDLGDGAEDSPITTIKNGKHLTKITNRATARRRGSSPPPPDFLPRKFLELKVFDIDVQDTKPQGPGDLWTCPFEDCFTKVHDGVSDVGKDKIYQHLKTHQNSAQDRIHLAINESRPYLPVDNLVRRLQAIAPNAGVVNLDDPSRQFAAPIRQKY